MRAELYINPLDEFPIALYDIPHRMTITELLRTAEMAVPEWFKEQGAIVMGGHIIERELWPHVKLKAEVVGAVHLYCVPGDGKALGTALALAATVAALAVASFGIPFLGVAGGSFLANLIAGGIGLIGATAAGALSAVPLVGNTGDSQQTQKTLAGISANGLAFNDYLPVIFGKMGVSPPLLIPPYTTYKNGSTYVTAIVGVEGRCKIENIKINGISTDRIAGLTIEAREGAPGDDPRTIGVDTVIEQRLGVTLSEFNTIKDNSTFPVPLITQPLDVNDTPQWHGMKTAGVADDFTLQFLMPGGAVDSGTPSNDVSVPIRIQIRLKGSTTWRNLPEFHMQDIAHGSGALRALARFIFTADLPGGRLIGRNSSWPIRHITNSARKGQSNQYDADPYFMGPSIAGIWATGTGWINNFNASGPTTSGMTVSASTTNGGNSPWKAFDGQANLGSYWQSASNGGPHTLQVDFSVAKTIKSYYFIGWAGGSGIDQSSPVRWRLYGSNDTWVTAVPLDDGPIDATSPVSYYNYCNVQHPDAYTSYRWVIDKVYSASCAYTIISGMHLFSVPAGCASIDAEAPSTPNGDYMVHSSDTSKNRCQYAALDPDGVTFYLDPAQWTPGEYEVQVMRGMPLPSKEINPYNYAITNGNATAGLFNYTFNGYNQVCAAYGYYYRSDTQVELIRTHQAVAPFDPTGIAFIAITAQDMQVNSIFAEFTRYAPIWDGNVWTEIEQPTQNAGALARQLLLGGANARPVPPEVINEDMFVDAYLTSVANDYQCNAALQGARVGEAFQMLCSCMLGAPKTAAEYGVILDKDVSALPVTHGISPMNSQDKGTQVSYPVIAHGIHATYFDETDSYAQNSVDVYRVGYDETTATIFDTINYPGFTNLSRVGKRAQFDIDQFVYRKTRFNRTVFLEGLDIERGDLVGLSDDVLANDQWSGIITSVTTSAGNVTSITLEQIMPWSNSANIETVDDVVNLSDVLNPSRPMGAAIRIPEQQITIRQVTNITDSNTCNFTTPFPDDGTVVPGLLVFTGNLNNVFRRCKVFEVHPNGFESTDLVLIDEAPNLIR